MKTYPACRDCKHHFFSALFTMGSFCRRKSHSTSFNAYSGEYEYNHNPIDDERNDDNLCGLEAKYFERKE